MRVALYVRVSTADQNPDTQLLVLRRYCEARGWQIVKEYVDQASGAVAERPQLENLMRDAGEHKFEALLVWKFDRLFRSVAHMLDSLEQFRYRSVEFVSITECVDTSTPMGRMVYTFLAAIAEFERDLIRERTRAGMARARAEGKSIGRPPVEWDADRALQLLKSGLTYRAIGERMGVSPSKVFNGLREAVLKSAESLSKRP